MVSSVRARPEGELIPQALEGQADLASGDPRGDEPLRGAQQDEILEGEPVLAPNAPPRVDESGARP